MKLRLKVKANIQKDINNRAKSCSLVLYTVIFIGGGYFPSLSWDLVFVKEIEN